MTDAIVFGESNHELRSSEVFPYKTNCLKQIWTQFWVVRARRTYPGAKSGGWAGGKLVNSAPGDAEGSRYALRPFLQIYRRMFSGKLGDGIYHLTYKIGKCIFSASYTSHILDRFVYMFRDRITNKGPT